MTVNFKPSIKLRVAFLLMIVSMIFANGLIAPDHVWAATATRGENSDVDDAEDVYASNIDERYKGLYKIEKRKFEWCAPYNDTERELYIDSNGKPRIYVFAGGSEDSAVVRELFYDTRGALRFANISARAVNGTELEHKVFFSTGGEKIAEVQNLLEGPGYTFPREWPESEFIKNPFEALLGKNSCREIFDAQN